MSGRGCARVSPCICWAASSVKALLGARLCAQTFPYWSTRYCEYKYVCVLSRVQLFATLYTVARQAPLCMGFSRQEYQKGLPCPPPGHLPDPGIDLVSLMPPALAGGFFTTIASRGTLEYKWLSLISFLKNFYFYFSPYFLKKFLLMWTILKLFIESVTILLLLYVLVLRRVGS